MQHVTLKTHLIRKGRGDALFFTGETVVLFDKMKGGMQKSKMSRITLAHKRRNMETHCTEEKFLVLGRNRNSNPLCSSPLAS
jgi:hypothetical protein